MRPLPAFEITVGCGNAVFSGGNLVLVHAQASRTARFAHFKTGVGENLVQPFGAGLVGYLVAARNNPYFHVFRFLPAFHKTRHQPQILNAGIGAATDEYIIHGLAQQRCAGFQPHVFQRLAERGVFGNVFQFGQRRDAIRNLHAHAGVGSVRDHGFNVFGAESQNPVIFGSVIGAQGFPMGYFPVQFLALGRETPATDIGKCHFVGGNHAAPRAHFNAHVADGHAGFHAQVADGIAGVFHKITGGSAGRNLCDDVKDNVFGQHPPTQHTVDFDAHFPGFVLHDALRGKHHFHFRSADAKRHIAKRAVRTRVRIAADNGHAGQREAQFRPDNVDYALKRMAQIIEFNAKIGAILAQRLHLQPRQCVFYG